MTTADMRTHADRSDADPRAWSFAPFVLGVLSLSAIITQMFDVAHGSILVAALFHFQINGPAWPDAQPWENYLFALVAIAVVLANRKAMLTRDAAATEVLMPEAQRA